MFKYGLLTLCALYVVPMTVSAASADRDHWYNRPNVIAAGNRLAKEIEHFDESLHNAKAPAHLIQKAHHFEETVTEFVESVRMGIAQPLALNEFNHIRQDIYMIRQEMYAHPNLLTHSAVSQEWRHVWTSYRALDHEMYHRQLTSQERSNLEEELRSIDAAH